MAKATKDATKGTPTLDPVATPDRVPTEEGHGLTVVFGTAPDLRLTFNTKALRDNSAEMIQNAAKRGAQPKGFKIRAREGTFYFVSLLYVVVEGEVNPRAA